MKKLIAAIPILLAAVPALAWVDTLPGNPAAWSLSDDFHAYQPDVCLNPGADFGPWHVVADGSLGRNANCVEVNVGAKLVLRPQTGNSALVLSNATEGGGVASFPAGNLWYRVSMTYDHRKGAATEDVGFVMWKFSAHKDGDTYYQFVPSTAGWTLFKVIEGTPHVLASGSQAKFLPNNVHTFVVYQQVGGDIRIFAGGAIKNDRVTGIVRLIEVVDPSPLVNGRYGFGTTNATLVVQQVDGARY